MGSGCLIEGRGGINFLPLKRGGLLEGGAYLTGGFNIGFTVYFTIIEVKKIIRRFFYMVVPLYKGLPLYSLLTKKIFFSVTFAGSLWRISQRN